mmetsp:Transcript_113199/g.320396  ORF Transcript_113199/g.320396 Transcript_113199/m.320396 type:complete len:272 (+) Transcript_113199:946-1761(+)
MEAALVICLPTTCLRRGCPRRPLPGLDALHALAPRGLAVWRVEELDPRPNAVAPTPRNQTQVALFGALARRIDAHRLAVYLEIRLPTLPDDLEEMPAPAPLDDGPPPVVEPPKLAARDNPGEVTITSVDAKTEANASHAELGCATEPMAQGVMQLPMVEKVRTQMQPADGGDAVERTHKREGAGRWIQRERLPCGSAGRQVVGDCSEWIHGDAPQGRLKVALQLPARCDAMDIISEELREEQQALGGSKSEAGGRQVHNSLLVLAAYSEGV